MYADVVIPRVPVSPFTYNISEKFNNWIEIGSRVSVPVKKKIFTGFVIDIKHQSAIKRTKDIIAFKEPIPLIHRYIIDLIKWVSEYYVSPLPECFKAAVPSRLLTLPEASVLIDRADYKNKEILSSNLPDLFVFEPEIEEIKSGVNDGSIALKYKRRKLPQIDGRPHDSTLRYNQAIVPNEAQQKAVDTVLSDIRENILKNYLLYGVTGSGKTLVYMEAAKSIIESGRSVLILVPEISLTPVMEKRFVDAFGERVAVLHSRLSPSERFRRWELVRRGICDVAVGPRSTVFAPLKNLGLIVVDEEQDTSYKQESPSPRYNARDTALIRGKIESVPVILGSATPSLESFYNARSDKFKLLILPERPGGSRLPAITVLNMQKERSVATSLSTTLVTRMNDILASGKQSLLLLNRRGYARYVRCAECGKMWRCPDCDINYIFHTQTKRLICHYCGKTESAPDSCPECKSTSISLFGAGTQRLEKTLNELFPEANIIRMDIDSTFTTEKLESIINDVTEGRANILMGTQMVGKGFDFPDILLTGILSTDLGLSFPDFRARENTFRLLIQAAGRAGRRLTPGEVLIQTFTPDDYSICFAAEQNFEGFYEEEIVNRRKLFYPPFAKLVLFTLSASDPRKAEKSAHALGYKLSNLRDEYSGRLFRILGPAPAPLFKIRKLYRYQILVKVDSVLKFNTFLKKYYPDAPMGIVLPKIRLSINIDPQDML